MLTFSGWLVGGRWPLAHTRPQRGAQPMYLWSRRPRCFGQVTGRRFQQQWGSAPADPPHAAHDPHVRHIDMRMRVDVDIWAMEHRFSAHGYAWRRSHGGAASYVTGFAGVWLVCAASAWGVVCDI